MIAPDDPRYVKALKAMPRATASDWSPERAIDAFLTSLASAVPPVVLKATLCVRCEGSGKIRINETSTGFDIERCPCKNQKSERIICARDSDWCDGAVCRADQVGFNPGCPNADSIDLDNDQES